MSDQFEPITAETIREAIAKTEETDTLHDIFYRPGALEIGKQAIHHKNSDAHDNSLDNLEVIPMPDDAEEGYCDWLRERDRIENERQAEKEHNEENRDW